MKLYAASDDDIAYVANSVVLGMWSEKFAAGIQDAMDDGWTGECTLKLCVLEPDADEVDLADLLFLMYSNASREAI